VIRDLDLNSFSSCCPVADVEDDAVDLLNAEGRNLRQPSRKQIKAAEQQAFDQLWYGRHVYLSRPEAGEKSAIKIETMYGKQALQRCEACLFRLEGRLGMLRWVLSGAPFNNYDT
jgi:hypothetical protein